MKKAPLHLSVPFAKLFMTMMAGFAPILIFLCLLIGILGMNIGAREGAAAKAVSISVLLPV